MLLKYSQRDYLRIGQLLSVREPEKLPLDSDIIRAVPFEINISRVPFYLNNFLSLTGKTPSPKITVSSSLVA